MTRDDVPAGKGQYDVRLQVDGEVEVRVRGNRVYIHTFSGHDARDAGSECNEPLPAGRVDGFGFEVRNSRGDIALVSGRTAAVVPQCSVSATAKAARAVTTSG